MAKLTPKELGHKAAEREFYVGPQDGFWEWQFKLPVEQWDDALKAYTRRRAVLEEQAKGQRDSEARIPGPPAPPWPPAHNPVG